MITTLDTRVLKSEWTPAHYALYDTIPQEIRNIAGDIFEIKWYGGGDLKWELENNIFESKVKAVEFMKKFNALTIDQKNLIYYAYEA